MSNRGNSFENAGARIGSDGDNVSPGQFSAYVPRLLELVNDLVFSLSVDAKSVLYVNQAAEKIYGRPLDEILNTKNLWIDCIHKDDRDDLLAKIRSIIDARDFEHEFRIVQPNGNNRYLQGNFHGISDERNRLVAIGCIAKDVTHRIHTEFALEESKAIYHSLVESLPINVFRKDRDGRIVFVNSKYCETIGRPLEQLIGQTDFDLFEKALAEKYLKDDKWVLQTGLPFHDIEFHQNDSSDGNDYIYVEVLKAPVTSSNGRRIGIQGMFWDVTDRKKAEIELEKAKDIAVAASQAKSDFLANVSHEIRTPLNAVIGMTDLLLGSKTDKNQREYLHMIQDSGQSLLTLINDILDFSKIESGKLDLDSEWFDIREKFGDTLRTLAFRAHRKGVDLICNIDPGVPTQILGDSQRLRQIVLNLVGNSIKFTHRGEIVVDVECVNVSDDSADLKFQIKDTGIGIPVEKLSEIFEEFVQVDTSTTRKYGGTGLGLAIASSLVGLMGGKLEVTSEIDVGTLFHFTLNFPTAKPFPRLTAPNEFAEVPVLVMARNPIVIESLDCILKFWRMKSFCVRDIEQGIKLAKGMSYANEPVKIVLAESCEDESGCDVSILAQKMFADSEIEDPVFISLLKASSSNEFVPKEDDFLRHCLLQPVKYSELKEAVFRCLTPGTQPLTSEHVSDIEIHGPYKILLAEDNPVNQKLAVGILKKHGHQMTVVDNGLKAIEALAQQQYDLILMDVQMPEMDGIEATRQIRNNEVPSAAKTPIIAMTAHAMHQDRQRCLEAGMDEYLSKPFKASDLIELIDRLMVARSREQAKIATMNSGQNVFIDWNQAFDTVGGDRKLLVELIEIFLKEKDDMLGELGTAIERLDFETANRIGHTLKGTLFHLGVTEIAEIAKNIERLEKTDSKSAASLFDELQNQINQLTIELQVFTNNHS